MQTNPNALIIVRTNRVFNILADEDPGSTQLSGRQFMGSSQIPDGFWVDPQFLGEGINGQKHYSCWQIWLCHLFH